MRVLVSVEIDWCLLLSPARVARCSISPSWCLIFLSHACTSHAGGGKATEGEATVVGVDVRVVRHVSAAEGVRFGEVNLILDFAITDEQNRRSIGHARGRPVRNPTGEENRGDVVCKFAYQFSHCLYRMILSLWLDPSQKGFRTYRLMALNSYFNLSACFCT